MIIKVIVYNNFLNVKKIFSDNFFFNYQIMQSFVKNMHISMLITSKYETQCFIVQSLTSNQFWLNFQL